METILRYPAVIHSTTLLNLNGKRRKEEERMSSPEPPTRKWSKWSVLPKRKRKRKNSDTSSAKCGPASSVVVPGPLYQNMTEAYSTFYGLHAPPLAVPPPSRSDQDDVRGELTGMVIGIRYRRGQKSASSSSSLTSSDNDSSSGGVCGPPSDDDGSPVPTLASAHSSLCNKGLPGRRYDRKRRCSGPPGNEHDSFGGGGEGDAPAAQPEHPPLKVLFSEFDENCLPRMRMDLGGAMSFSKTPRIITEPNYPYRILYANAAYSKLTGIDFHDITRRPLSAILGDSSSPPFHKHDTAAAASSGLHHSFVAKIRAAAARGVPQNQNTRRPLPSPGGTICPPDQHGRGREPAGPLGSVRCGVDVMPLLAPRACGAERGVDARVTHLLFQIGTIAAAQQRADCRTVLPDDDGDGNGGDAGYGATLPEGGRGVEAPENMHILAIG